MRTTAIIRMVAGSLTSLALCVSALNAQDYTWPREIPVSGGATGTIVLYQPQAEKLTGNELTARGAIALKVTGRPDPIFGAMWMRATVDVDRDSGMVWLHDLKITRVRWPDATPDQQARFTQYVETDFPPSGFRMTIARLQASLASAEAERSHTDGLKNDAPKIVFSEQLAVLLLYDGEPRLQPIDSTPLALVVNTPFGVVKDTTTGIYWLTDGATWYSATDPKGPWQAPATPPAVVAKMQSAETTVAEADTSTKAAASVQYVNTLAPKPDSTPPPPRPDTLARTDSSAARRDTSTTHADSAINADTLFAPPPAIITATEPTELVVTQGPPTWKTTAGGKLLYVENTETPWIRETEGRDNYLLISGRWFKSESLQGPWTFARPDSLPAAFQEIPPESPIGGVRSAIALTVEAQDALLDLEIPQTTAVQRSQATLAVKYDGEPKFVDITGTTVAYATNTASQVLRVGGAYYACDNAVWFKSASAQGPWVVADSIPKDAISKIPPSVPVYNLTYVAVYASTPEVVYVGYTPGYTGAYPYYGVPVYGTGWYYPPYIGSVYYPHPVTYGVAVSYNPYTGWGMGTTFAAGFFAVGIGVAIGSSSRYYPAGGYRACYNCTINTGGGRGNAGRGGRNQVNIGNTAGGGNRPTAGNRASQGGRGAGGGRANSSIYNRPENRGRTANRQSRDRASTQIGGANRTARGQNNVFADRNGNVSRRTNNGWESRQGSSWSKDRAGTNRGGQEREYQARQRSSSRGGGGGSRGGGRSGGGRRR
ncbi:MAG TPA: hypothetical protein VGU74_12910 [Gemmatimonadales bacterium]|nr:hypothetical protein [Gemmatimonadales bacterium]